MRRWTSPGPLEHNHPWEPASPPAQAWSLDAMEPSDRPTSGTTPGASPALEWLVTNGLGGYASGTVLGPPTRRYHGLLVAALPAPQGRTVMLGPCVEHLVLGGRSPARLGLDRFDAEDDGNLAGFRLESGLPAWRFEVEGLVLEKRLLMSHLQNTTRVTYRLASGGPATLTIRPTVHFRGHDERVDSPRPADYPVTVAGDRVEVAAGGGRPPLRLAVLGRGSTFQLDPRPMPEVRYPVEAERGYEAIGRPWSPGWFTIELAGGESATLVASAEPWGVIEAFEGEEVAGAESGRRSRLVAGLGRHAEDPVAARLVLAADQFLIAPVGRLEDAARARARGDEPRAVIAGYHWFTDWGRDTLIGLEGLTLATGRPAEARAILLGLARSIRDGLVPNLIPEGSESGLYHTADATLWFFHAVARYLDHTGDRPTLLALAPRLFDVIDHHLRGTRFGIGVDPLDGLLRQGEAGYQLTWMDAKVGDWVVTPRRGKAVEINALWYNALKLLANWAEDLGRPGDAEALAGHAERARVSFNRRFWSDEVGHLLDVVDGESGDDPSCRPNQLFAIALDHPILDRARWAPVVETCRDRLLTPVGLRSLAPGHPDYHPSYEGDLRSRDAAYHQGTVWSWLIGPFVDSWLKVHPGAEPEARGMLGGLVAHLDEAGLGSVSEVFDAESPFTPRGCVAQAWGVAELLRCWIKTAP